MGWVTYWKGGQCIDQNVFPNFAKLNLAINVYGIVIIILNIWWQGFWDSTEISENCKIIGTYLMQWNKHCVNNKEPQQH